MRRTIKHPDGREEVHEGTPEELAAYERAAGTNPLKSLSKEEYNRLPDPEVDPFRRSGFNPLFQEWSPPVSTGHACMFDGLPDGVYGIACPCPRHGVVCQ